MARSMKAIGKLAHQKGSDVLSRKTGVLMRGFGFLERSTERDCRLILTGPNLRGIGRRVYDMVKELRPTLTEQNT